MRPDRRVFDIVAIARAARVERRDVQLAADDGPAHKSCAYSGGSMHARPAHAGTKSRHGGGLDAAAGARQRAAKLQSKSRCAPDVEAATGSRRTANFAHRPGHPLHRACQRASRSAGMACPRSGRRLLRGAHAVINRPPCSMVNNGRSNGAKNCLDASTWRSKDFFRIASGQTVLYESVL